MSVWSGAILAGLSAEGGPATVLARGGADAAVLSLFGALLFGAVIADGAAVRRVAWWSLAASAGFTAGWALLEAVGLGGSAAALPDLLTDTQFGHLAVAQLVLMAATGAVLRRRGLAAGLSGLLAASEAGHGHALAMYGGPSALLVSEVLHLLAAGAWLGGLLPLALLVRSAPAEAAARAARRFSPLGAGCVLVLAGTALFQGDVLIMSVAGLIGTAYGLVALLKVGLFAALLVFAARHRFGLVPGLVTGPEVRARLGRSVAWEAGVGLLTVLTAGLLASLEPSMHAQATWPFRWQLSFEAVSEEPEFLREVVLAGAAVVVALGLAGLGLALRWRVRWGLVAVAIAVAWVAAPHFDVLLAEAHPTEFWMSPTGFSSASIVRGAALFRQNCVACHGAEARGDGPAARSLAVPPADLTAAHLWMHPDGELFWWLSQGIEGPEGGLAMPGFAGTIDADGRWALIDWVRAHNAGLARVASGDWPVPLLAPGFAIACTDRERTALSDLRGGVVRVVFGAADAVPGLETVVLDPQVAAGPGVCVGADADAVAAYAVVTGLSPEAMRGAEVLVDGDGYLRALRRTHDDRDLPMALAAIRGQPRKATDMSAMGSGMKM